MVWLSRSAADAIWLVLEMNSLICGPEVVRKASNSICHCIMTGMRCPMNSARSANSLVSISSRVAGSSPARGSMSSSAKTLDGISEVFCFSLCLVTSLTNRVLAKASSSPWGVPEVLCHSSME